MAPRSSHITSGDLQIQTFYGQVMAPHLSAVARLRIDQFRHFPYLYSGSLAYEEQYLAGYLDEPRSQLVVVRHGDDIAAVATALPLASHAEIVADAPALFAGAGFAPETFYYYAEIVVLPAFRGAGIAKQIYAERQAAARRFGYTNLCLAVVERSRDHPLRPVDYVGPERVWIKDGFVKTDIRFTFDWPTIQPSGKVVETANNMVFWQRPLLK